MKANDIDANNNFYAVTLHWYCNMPFSSRDKALIKNVYQFGKKTVFVKY